MTLSFLLFSVTLTDCDVAADEGYYAHNVVVSDRLWATPNHASFYVGHGVSQAPQQFTQQAGVYLLFDGVCPNDHMLVTAYWFTFNAEVE